MILGAIAVVLGVVGIVIVAGVFSSVNRALREATGPAPASSYRITEESCERDSAGLAHDRGTITNTSNRSRNYEIKVEFLDPSGTRVGQGFKFVTGLGAGQTAQWETVDSVPGAATVQCRVQGVDNFFNSSRSESTTPRSTASSLGTLPSHPGVAASPIVKVGSHKIVVTATGSTATVAKADATPPTPVTQVLLTFDVDTATPIATANLTSGRYRGRYFLVTLLGGDTRLGALIGQRNGRWTLIPVQARGEPSFLTEGLAFGGPTGIQALQRDCIPNCAQGHEITVNFNFSPDGALVPSTALGADPRVHFDGIGPVKVGMTIDQAAKAAGVGFDTPPGLGSCGNATPVGATPDGLSFQTDSGVIARVDVTGGPIRTEEGLGIGSTEADVMKAYGSRVTVQPHLYTNGHYLVVRSDKPELSNYRIVFETDGTSVTRFRSGREPEVEFVEGCA